MPTLTIDGRSYTFEDGLTIMQACESVGIGIPHFCYYPKLSIVGSCRMCLVEVEKALTLQISCNTPIRDGMVVHTASERVKKARQGVLEFLLINHPLDCPICDQAGECPLQMITMKWGPDRSRFEEEKEHAAKRTEIGPHVMFDAERCIKCTRCARFCDEVTHTGELGLFERGDSAVIGIFSGKSLANDYSLCTADICPVGALTSREFRFQNRVWFMKQAKSVCPECSRGCSTTLWTNMKHEVQRMTPRLNDNVNDTWMCDDGRLSYLDWDPGARLRRAAARNSAGEEIPVDAALERAVEAIRAAVKAHGPGSVGAWASTFATNEELYLLGKLTDRVEVLPARDGRGDDILKRADKSPNRRGAQAVLKSANLAPDIESGKIKVLVAMKPRRAAELPAKPKALQKLDALIVIDSRKNRLVEMATHTLPAAMYVEEEGTWVNEFGWVQRFEAARPAPADARPAWQLLARMLWLAQGAKWSFQSPAQVFEALAHENAAFAGMSYARLGDAGLRLAGAEGPSR
jgi:NADH-quinone oxidoreductase subunit G